MARRFILAVDGGGIRGVAPAQMLTHLQDAMRAAGKGTITDRFDLFVGTSTGAILAAALAAGGPAAAYAEPQAIVNIYKDRGLEIFPRGFTGWLRNLFRRKYSSKPLATILEEVFRDLPLSGLQRNFMATFYSMYPATPRAVFAHGGPSYVQRPGNRYYGDMLLREVVLASTAAPTFFAPADVRDPSCASGQPEYVAIDGGVFANNPALCAYVEAKKLYPEDEITLVSMGCGAAATNYDERVRSWGIWDWIAPAEGVPLLKAVMHGQTDSVEHQIDYLLNGPNDNAFRFQFPLVGVAKEMDDATPENIAKLMTAGDTEMATGEAQAKLQALVALM